MTGYARIERSTEFVHVGRVGARKLGSISAAQQRATPWRVLIVDDVVDNREMYLEYLLHVGLIVEGAASAEEAIAILESAPLAPDVIVMDLSLPKMDGLEATRRIKTDIRFGEMKVLMLSGYAGPRYEQGALDAGVDLFVTKPCPPLDLFTRIKSLLPPAFTPEERSTERAASAPEPDAGAAALCCFVSRPSLDDQTATSVRLFR